MRRTVYASLALGGILLLGSGLAACSSSGSSGAQAAQSALSQAATNPAVLAAKQRAKDTVMTPCEGALPNLVAFKNCAYGKLGITGDSDAAKAKRHTLGNCLATAALHGHLTRTGGITAFAEGSGLECVAAALPPAKASASPTPTASSS